jgi:hypothetical protein
MTAPTRNDTAKHFLADLTHEVMQLAEIQTVQDQVLARLGAMKQEGRILDYLPPLIDRKYLEVIFFIPHKVYQDREAAWKLSSELRALGTATVSVQPFGRFPDEQKEQS